MLLCANEVSSSVFCAWEYLKRIYRMPGVMIEQ